MCRYLVRADLRAGPDQERTAMSRLYLFLCFATVSLVSLPAICGLDPAPARVAGEKLDSGAGSLPHYAQWGKHPTLHGLARPAPAGKAARGTGSQRADMVLDRP